MTLHIGIVAHSAEGATMCYRAMWLEGVRRLGAHNHPEITLTGIAMHHSLAAWEAGDVASVRNTFMHDVAKLAGAGADFFVVPDNTAHIALQAPGEAFPIPCLHIAEVVANRAKRDGRRRIGILGTKWTMNGPVYPRMFERYGLTYELPDRRDQQTVHDIIFEELCLGIIREQSRAAYVQVVKKLQQQGCDAVALVCTEIPLLLSPDVSPLPTLDSTRLLAVAAVEVAVGERDLPEWRGGPVTTSENVGASTVVGN
jgi:aspartate racemase